MIDPITAFATAQAAIKGVQAAIKMGKDIGAISGDLMKFFEAKDVVAKAATKPGKSDTAQAIEILMKAKQLQDAEDELKQMLIWSGNAPTWEAILRERNKIVHERKSREITADKAKAERRKEIEDVIEVGLIVMLIAAIVSVVAWGTMEYVDFMRR